MDSDTRKQFLWPSLVGLFLLLLALNPGRITSYDASIRLQVARALWTEGKLTVTEHPPETKGMVFLPKENRWASFFGIGQSLVLAPLDWALTKISKGLHLSEEETRRSFHGIIFLYAPLVGLAWFWFLYLFLFLFTAKKEEALLCALLFFLSSITLPYAAQSLQEESLVGLSLVASFYLLLKQHASNKRAPIFLAGLAFGFALLCRHTSALAILPLLGLARDREISFKNLLFFGFGLLAMGIVMAWSNGVRFGAVWVDPYHLYSAQYQFQLWKAPDLTVALAMLFGLGKGVFILSPLLILSLWGIPSLFRKSPRYCVGVIAALLLSVLIHSMKTRDADGSECWGTRYQVHLIPLFLPFLYEALGFFKRYRLALGTVFLVGVIIQQLACFAPDSLEYSQSRAQGRRLVLMSHPLKGQLGRRVQNVFYWAGGTLEETYVPNVWGPVVAKKMPNSSLAWGLSLLWALIFSGAVVILAKEVMQLFGVKSFPFPYKRVICANPP